MTVELMKRKKVRYLQFYHRTTTQTSKPYGLNGVSRAVSLNFLDIVYDFLEIRGVHRIKLDRSDSTDRIRQMYDYQIRVQSDPKNFNPNSITNLIQHSDPNRKKSELK